MFRFKTASALLLAGSLAPVVVMAQAPAPAARQLGTVKSISGSTVTLTTAAGAEVAVTIGEGAPVLQLPPGSTDLKSATPGQLGDISVGDRVLVTGKPTDTPGSFTAARVVLMKSGDIAARNADQKADWQKRGSGGLVRAVDGPVITIVSGAKSVKVETTPTTIFRRYADDSVKFEDAKAGTLSEVRPGDQLRVRGAKSDDGSSLTAEEVVTGSFDNLSGSIASIDAGAGTVTLKDLTLKKTVTVKVTSNSDLRRLPPQAAAAFAARQHPAGTPAAAGGGSPASGGGAAVAGASPAAGDHPRRSAGMDLSQMLSRLPTEGIADLKTGDAVMIVASRGMSAGSLTAITLLSGVEQILSATPSGAAPITLQPWNIGGAPEAGGQ